MKFKITASLVIVCALLLSQHKFLLTAYAQFFIVDNPTIGTNAVIAVLAGGRFSRIPKALELYDKGYGTRILITTPRPLNSKVAALFPSYEQDAAVIAKAFNFPDSFERVPSLKRGATSTFDEAHDLLAFCIEKKLKHLIIVTNSYHSRRALFAFKKIFKGSNIKVEVSAAYNEMFNAGNWWLSDQGISVYIIEPVKFFVYLFRSRNVSFIRND